MGKKSPPIAIVFEDEESPQFDHTYSGDGDNSPVIFYLRQDRSFDSEHPGNLFYCIQHRNWRGPFLGLLSGIEHQIWVLEYPQFFSSGLLRPSNSRNRNVQCFLE